jgi:WD40 repeat protein
MAVLVGHDNKVSLFVFSPDGQTLASTSGDLTTRLWSVTHGREVVCRRPEFVEGLAFSPDGNLLFVGHGSQHAGLSICRFRWKSQVTRAVCSNDASTVTFED